MSVINNFKYSNKFDLESGASLPGFRLAFQTFGTLNKDKSNVVWIIHALTANSNPTEWWPGVVGENKAINPKDHFIVCANSLASNYGSTYPLDINPDTGKKYYHSFPSITNRDIVNCFVELRKHLGIEKIETLIGASLGGQQALEWSIMEPEVIQNSVLIATNARHSPYGIAFNESQRLAIEADHTWKEDRDDAGQRGLVAARSIALISYRTSAGYNSTQHDHEEKLDGYRASSYQRYQGEKLNKRFNTFSYWTLTKAMDSHNVGRNRNGLKEALSRVNAHTTVIGIDSDILFPFSEQQFIADNIKNSDLHKISSALGHDGFLTESKKVGEIISNALSKSRSQRYLKVS